MGILKEGEQLVIVRDYSESELLFQKYAYIIAVKQDKGIISDEKYDRIYGKLLEWNLHKF